MLDLDRSVGVNRGHLFSLSSYHIQSSLKEVFKEQEVLKKSTNAYILILQLCCIFLAF